MQIIDIFNEKGKTLNELIEEYIIVTLQAIFDNDEMLYLNNKDDFDE